jgi:hypothetical protein
MIEVIGKDGRVFRFQNGTTEDVIKAALDQHYGQASSANTTQTNQGPAPAAYAPASAPYGEEEDVPPSNKAMRFTMMAGAGALGILVVLGGLWATGMIGRTKTAPTATTGPVADAQAVNIAFAPTPQPDARPVQVATQIRSDPRSDAPVLKEMVAGTTIDVLGEQTVAGTVWLRVKLDPVRGGEGYVIASHAGAFGSGVAATNGVGLPTNSVEGGVGAEIKMVETTFYATIEQLAVQTGPNLNLPLVERLALGAPVTALAYNGAGVNTWYKVRTASGQTGWLQANLVTKDGAGLPAPNTLPSNTLPSNTVLPGTLPTNGVMPEDGLPANAVSPDTPATDTDTVAKPPVLRPGTAITRAPRGYYVQAGAARNDSEVRDLIARSDEAVGCAGSKPKVYASEAFVKTKTRGMSLIAYGPFAARGDAIAFRDNLRPCIADTFISEQP